MTDLVEKITLVILTVVALIFGILSILCAVDGVRLIEITRDKHFALSLLLLVFFIALAITHYIQYGYAFWRKEDPKKRIERLALEKKISEQTQEQPG